LAEHTPTPPRGTTGWWWGTPSGPEGETVGQVEPMVVAQTWMLLHLTAPGGGRFRGRWVWALKSSAPERWLALRRAVMRHAR